LCFGAYTHPKGFITSDPRQAELALPGGFGTWEEFSEAVTWSQLGLHRKACALLNVEGFYDAFLAQADRAVKDGFVSEVHRSLVISGSDPERIVGATRAIPGTAGGEMV
jgi:uncharacterized protein (TIGR00730 family)